MDLRQNKWITYKKNKNNNNEFNKLFGNETITDSLDFRMCINI